MNYVYNKVIKLERAITMNYLEIAFMRSSKPANIPLKCMKKCNAITCIYNCSGFCIAFKDSKCDFHEETKIPEQ